VLIKFPVVCRRHHPAGRRSCLLITISGGGTAPEPPTAIRTGPRRTDRRTQPSATELSRRRPGHRGLYGRYCKGRWSRVGPYPDRSLVIPFDAWVEYLNPYTPGLTSKIRSESTPCLEWLDDETRTNVDVRRPNGHYDHESLDSR
jgi:hypothetical protein